METIAKWCGDKNQRAKLQNSYLTVGVFLVIVAGLISLVNADLGHRIVVFGGGSLAIFAINAVVWSIIDLIISPKIKSAIAKRRR